jgi:Uma2 family endonuclease
MRNFGHILKHGATIEDLEALPPETSAEIINGELVEKAAPSFDHGDVQAGLTSQLGSRFRGPPRDGSGGWWFVTEVEVEYAADQVFRHDLTGWRRSNVPERPSGWPVRIRPDWVCEILSPSNASNDSVKKLRVLHQQGVPHFWLVDPERRTLSVLRWTETGYLNVLAAEAGERVRAEPFDAIELDTTALFEGG